MHACGQAGGALRAPQTGRGVHELACLHESGGPVSFSVCCSTSFHLLLLLLMLLRLITPEWGSTGSEGGRVPV